MPQQSQAGEDYRVIMMQHILPSLLIKGFSLAHEEVHGLSDEAIQHMRMVSMRNHFLHEGHFTLDQAQEDASSHHERRATFQSFVKQTQSTRL